MNARKKSGAGIEILLVEDNAADVRLTEEAFKEAQIQPRLHVVGDGVEAMDYLHSRGQYGGAARPHLILLDLNLPRKTGLEVLAEVKRDVELMRIPVVVLTTSRAQEDVGRSYDLHANAYVTKPTDLDEFVTIIDSLRQFWLDAVVFSSAGSTALRP